MFLRSLFAGALTLCFAAQTYLSAQPAPEVNNDILEAYHERHHSNDHTFVGPTLRGIVASPTCCYGAYSFLGELAPRNFRFDATFAYEVCDNHFFKLTLDLLTQKLRYKQAKHKHVWVHQESYGIGYAYNWNCGIISTLDADVYWTRAHSKDFSKDHQQFSILDADFTPGTQVHRDFLKNISGARAWGLSFGFTMEPLECVSVSLAANYDNVDYRTKFRHLDQKAGWGGTARIHYQMFDCFGIDLQGAWRRPYDDYQAAINWYFEGCCPCDRTAIGIFGGYTNGKYGVPNVGNAGLQLAYWFGGNGYDCSNCDPCCDPCSSFDIVAWASRPAVFQPVVLATHDTREELRLVVPATTN